MAGTQRTRWDAVTIKERIPVALAPVGSYLLARLEISFGFTQLSQTDSPASEAETNLPMQAHGLTKLPLRVQ